ncbi:RICIN domain-containing protein [Streptomyces subrutilus]|uniref:Ricin B lectin domain-containing protein n=1 Tax=Streptomyces subrutilus TaxID=36818 RepID=A0A1E5PKP7_9ACTN|nr:RICIN domain-containing protein [Streptomyces subrutilus]OEJ30146.1 hypothetical protein BGK67_01055 [Streptomyces subrutilus]
MHPSLARQPGHLHVLPADDDRRLRPRLLRQHPHRTPDPWHRRRCVDVAAGSDADRTPIRLHDRIGSAARQWTYTPVPDLTNTGGGTCLDAKGNSSADGTRLQTWTCTGAANQKWTVG